MCTGRLDRLLVREVNGPMYLLASNASWGMFGAGVMLLIFLLLRRSRRYLGKTSRPTTTRGQQRAQQGRSDNLLDAPPDLLRWQVAMHETARDLKAELDSKMVALQVLIQLARTETAKLEETLDRAHRLGISDVPDSLEFIEQLARGDVSEPPSPTTSFCPQDLLERQRSEVYGLADQGVSSLAIAHAVGAPIADVELLLSLRTTPDLK